MLRRPGLARRHVELQIKHSRNKSPTATPTANVELNRTLLDESA
jgi:hypothetical protein